MSESEACHYIGMSRSFLARTRMEGDRKNRTPGPKYLKIGKSIRYDKSDLDAWIDSNRV